MAMTQAAGAADRQVRTSMFVMATIYAGSGSAAVKVRNLSSTGALIEARLLPPPGSVVRLCRGSLTVEGTVKWSSDGRAGLHFDVPTNVAHWLPGGEALLEQERVDAIFQEVKGSAEAEATTGEPPTADVTIVEILKVKDVLEQLAEDFSSDDYLVVNFGTKIQSLDLAAQILGKIAAEKSGSA